MRKDKVANSREYEQRGRKGNKGQWREGVKRVRGNERVRRIVNEGK